MKSTKSYIVFAGVFIFLTKAFGQITYDFSSQPLAQGWEYYSDSPIGGFTYTLFDQNIHFNLSEGTASQFYHRDLPTPLSVNYCVQFSFTPTSNSNYNTMFPLLLTESEQPGPHYHPWRENPIGASAGPMQNLDLIGIEIFGLQVRFVHRNDAASPPSIIQPLNPPFTMTVGNTYLIRLEVTNSTNVVLSVFGGINQSQLLAQENYTIPLLEPMSHLYISNGNGNWTTDQFGYVDDYSINQCDQVEVPEEPVPLDSVVISSITIPNILTANGDNLNDNFILPKEDITSYNVTILNRWGVEIYSSNEKKGWLFWDGKDKSGKMCNEGVYYYLFNAILKDSQHVQQHGFIQLLTTD